MMEGFTRTEIKTSGARIVAVHGGHEPSFGRERLIALADAYLENAQRQGYAARAGTVAGREPNRS